MYSEAALGANLYLSICINLFMFIDRYLYYAHIHVRPTSLVIFKSFISLLIICEYAGICKLSREVAGLNKRIKILKMAAFNAKCFQEKHITCQRSHHFSDLIATAPQFTLLSFLHSLSVNGPEIVWLFLCPWSVSWPRLQILHGNLKPRLYHCIPGALHIEDTKCLWDKCLVHFLETYT